MGRCPGRVGRHCRLLVGLRLDGPRNRLGDARAPHLCPLGHQRGSRLQEVDRGVREGAPRHHGQRGADPLPELPGEAPAGIHLRGGPGHLLGQHAVAVHLDQGQADGEPGAVHQEGAPQHVPVHPVPGVAAHLPGRDLRAAQGLGHDRGLLQRELLRPAPHPGPEDLVLEYLQRRLVPAHAAAGHHRQERRQRHLT